MKASVDDCKMLDVFSMEILISTTFDTEILNSKIFGKSFPNIQLKNFRRHLFKEYIVLL